ncbi:MAG: hypothetical protein O3A51_07455 [Verrucomicrobia bacterium]|nr:hypothetical protein [Verrucomicrobiota bacterium]
MGSLLSRIKRIERQLDAAEAARQRRLSEIDAQARARMDPAGAELARWTPGGRVVLLPKGVGLPVLQNYIDAARSASIPLSEQPP